MSCKIISLYSGSKGNATLISSATTSILIDAGKSARSLFSALTDVGESIEHISAIFITHEHCDHVSALETVAKKHSIPIHITSTSAKKLLNRCDALDECLVTHDNVFTEQVGDITVTSFRTPHDSMMSVGYRIELSDGERKRVVGIATDIGYVTPSVREGLLGCEAVVLEANHDEQMLMDGPYPYHLKLRISSNRGHLSNRESAEFASYLAENGTTAFILAHLSEENNTPERAFDEYQSILSDSRIFISIASQIFPTEITL